MYVAFLIIARMTEEELQQRQAEPIRKVLEACAKDAINQTAEVKLILDPEPFSP